MMIIELHRQNPVKEKKALSQCEYWLVMRNRGARPVWNTETKKRRSSCMKDVEALKKHGLKFKFVDKTAV